MENLSALNFKCLNSDNNKEEIFYYEKYSKNLIKITSNTTEIYNEHNKLIKSLNLRLPSELILFISIDSNFELMCIFFEKTQGKNKILFINLLNTKNPIITIDYNSYDYVMGIFFIGNNKNDLKKDYIMIFPNKLVYNTLIRSGTIKYLLTHNFSNYLINDFSYSYQYKYLCCRRSDDLFDFIDLSEPKNYDKICSRTFPFCKKSINSKLSISENSLNIKRTYEVFNSIEKYVNSQFFLQMIYNQLFFICLSYEYNKIYTAQFYSLPDNFINESLIDIPPLKVSTLQFIDNLLIIHSFMEKVSYIYEIPKQRLINKGTITDFPYHKYLIVSGNYLEEKKGNQRILYNIEFDCEKFCENSYELIKKGNKLNIIDIAEPLFNRINSQTAVFHLLYRMINDNYKSIDIIKIFKYLRIVNDKKNSYSFDDKKKMIITSEAIENQFFKLFLQNENLSEDLLNHIINYMAYLKNLWLYKKNKIKNVLSSFDELIITFIKKLDNVYEVLYSFDNSYIYYNSDYSFYLISKNNNFEKFGINLLIKISAYEEVFEYYCKKGNFNEIIYFIEQYHNQIKNNFKVLFKYKNLIVINKKKVLKLLK